jgi:hypothetical protein
VGSSESSGARRFRCFGCGRFTDEVTEDGPTAESAGQTHRWTTGVRLVRDHDEWRAAVACWWCYWQGGAGRTITAAQWDAFYPVVYSDQLPFAVPELLSAQARDPATYRWPLRDLATSTKIFLLQPDPEVEGIAFEDSSFELGLSRKLRLSTRIGEDWQPPRILIDREPIADRRLRQSDFPASIAAPSFSRRAVDGLRHLLAPCGELLPTICDEGEYFLFNVTAVCDVLDEERSILHQVRDTVLEIHRHVFKTDAGLSPATVMFKLPCRNWGRAVYVTDVFVERVRELGLTGLRVELVGAIP